MHLGLSILFYVVAAGWLVIVLRVMQGGMTLKKLPPADQLPAPERAPRVSAIIPARDEQDRIETTVRHLFAQRGVELEVIVADDRSSDQTPAILGRLAPEFPRLKVVRIDQLPEGWIGKCHAMHRAAAEATGDWLLFSDGDIHLTVDALARAVACAEQAQADHITLTPSQVPDGRPLPSSTPDVHQKHAGNPFFQATMTVFAMILAVYLGRANRGARDAMGGVGAFNLVRGTLYRKMGGHEPLRLEVADDMKLGLVVGRAGGRTRALIGADDVQCDWAGTVGQLFKALEKNLFAGVNFSLPRVLGYTLAVTFLWAGSIAALFYLPHHAALAAALGPMLFALTGLIPALASGYSLLGGLLTPLGMWLMLGVLWNSTLRTLRQGGIRWRDTFYPLSLLKQGNVR